MKRHIRFREFEANIDLSRSPSRLYASKARHLSNDNAYRIQTDANGYITSGRIFEAQKKICIIGDSLIESMFVDESKRWNSYLEKLLLENGFPFKTYSAGYSGATSLNILNTLLNKVFMTNFDMLVYVVSSNDYSATSYEKSYWNFTKNHSNLLLTEYNDEKPDYKNFKENDFKTLIKCIYEVAEKFNQNFWLATYPNLCENSALDKLNNQLRTICDENNYKLLDLDRKMHEYEISCEKHFYDKLHLSSSGSIIFSEALYEFCTQEIGPSFNKVDSLIISNKLITTKTLVSSQDPLNINDLKTNDSLELIQSFNIIIDVEYIQLSSDDSFIIKLHNNQPGSSFSGSDVQYSKNIGWYISIKAPQSKKIEISYSFQSLSSDLSSLEIICNNKDSEMLVNAITLEYIKK